MRTKQATIQEIVAQIGTAPDPFQELIFRELAEGARLAWGSPGDSDQEAPPPILDLLDNFLERLPRLAYKLRAADARHWTYSNQDAGAEAESVRHALLTMAREIFNTTSDAAIDTSPNEAELSFIAAIRDSLIPKVVPIGPHRVPVWYGPRALGGDRSAGRFDLRPPTIFLRARCPDTGTLYKASRVYRTLLHEVSHALDYLEHGGELWGTDEKALGLWLDGVIDQSEVHYTLLQMEKTYEKA